MKAKDLYRCAQLAASVYDARYDPKSPLSASSQRLFNNHHAVVRSVPLKRNLIGAEGYLHVACWEDEDTVVYAFSGTRDLEYWLYNLDPGDNKYGNHAGYDNLTRHVMYHLGRLGWFSSIKRKTAYLTGHSAGGAVAVLAAEYLHRDSPTVVDFGTPKVFRRRSGYVPKRYRFQNPWDIVPCTPLGVLGPLKGFTHGCPPIWVTGDGLLEKAPRFRTLRIAARYAASVVRLRLTDKIREEHSMTATYLLGVLQDLNDLETFLCLEK